MKHVVIGLALAALATPTLALEALPKEKGFSGYVNLGVGTGSIESNFLARIPHADVDLGSETITEFDSPDDESLTLPALNINFGYTFAGGKTRAFIGSDLEDFLQFDRSTVLALRHDFDRLGRTQVSLLTSAFPGTEVWADPYVLGEKRKKTDFSSTGVRLTWDQIFGSQFEVKLTSRDRDIDDENSGDSLGLSNAQRKLLDRNGDVMRAEVGYMFNLGNGHHFVRPSVAYIDYDLDGDAMAQDGFEAAVSWAYIPGKNFRWVNNVMYQSLEGDKKNPIFNDVSDQETFGLASQMFFPGAFGWKKWTPNISAIWADADNDIDFNDSSGWMINAGVFRRF